MKYNIGDVARTLGLTPSALHYFEREGIISPSKEDSGHRVYYEEDVFRLMSYLKYRNMGVSVKEIAQQFSPDGDSLSVISQRLAQKREEAEKQEEHFRALQDNIKWFEEAIARIPLHLDQYDLCFSPEVTLVNTKGQGLIPQDPAICAMTQAWLQDMSRTRLSVAMDLDGQAFVTQAKQGDRTSEFPNSDHVIHLQPMIAVHTILSVSNLVYETPSMAFSKALAYLDEYHFSPNAMAFGHVLVVDCSEGERRNYLELWIPFTAFT